MKRHHALGPIEPIGSAVAERPLRVESACATSGGITAVRRPRYEPSHSIPPATVDGRDFICIAQNVCLDFARSRAEFGPGRHGAEAPVASHQCDAECSRTVGIVLTQNQWRRRERKFSLQDLQGVLAGIKPNHPPMNGLAAIRGTSIVCPEAISPAAIHSGAKNSRVNAARPASNVVASKAVASKLSKSASPDQL